jgi:hypothetical protein
VNSLRLGNACADRIGTQDLESGEHDDSAAQSGQSQGPIGIEPSLNEQLGRVIGWVRHE